MSNESFVKVGITSFNLIRRFEITRQKYNDFQFKKIDLFWFDHPQTAKRIESELQDQFAEYKFIPLIKFGGWTECFKLDALDLLKAEFGRLKKLHSTNVRKHR